MAFFESLAAGEISSGFLLLIIALIIWSLIWKLIALWKSARNNQTAWFVILGIVNTIGILDILYIYIFSRKKSAGKAGKKRR